MLEQALYHKPETEYCYPISENTIALRLRASKTDALQVDVVYGGKYDFYEKRQRGAHEAVVHRSAVQLFYRGTDAFGRPPRVRVRVERGGQDLLFFRGRTDGKIPIITSISTTHSSLRISTPPTFTDRWSG